MLENCKRLICSPSLNKVYCIVLYCTAKFQVLNFVETDRYTEGHGFGSRQGLGLFFLPCSRHVELPSVCSRNNIGA